MIRAFIKEDIDRIMEIWLNTNIEVHKFVDEKYWKSNFDMVKKIMYEAEIYVYERENVIESFIGLMDNYVAGIFVDSEFRSQGIGKSLVDYVKGIKNELTLSVYAKNERAINFYLKMGFEILSEGIDELNDEKEYTMKWCK